MPHHEPSHVQVMLFITLIRESFDGSVIVYTQGSCFRFHLILRAMFPEARAYYNSDHVITMIEGRYYDITGEVECTNHLPLAEAGSAQIRRLLKLKFTNFKTT